jgi:hypothetical protein
VRFTDVHPDDACLQYDTAGAGHTGSGRSMFLLTHCHQTTTARVTRLDKNHGGAHETLREMREEALTALPWENVWVMYVKVRGAPSVVVPRYREEGFRIGGPPRHELTSRGPRTRTLHAGYWVSSQPWRRGTHPHAPSTAGHPGHRGPRGCRCLPARYHY